MSPEPTNLQIAHWSELGAAFTKIEYEALLALTPVHSIFDTWAWITSCYDHLPVEHTPLIVSIRDGSGQLIAAAPLKIEQRKIAGLVVKTVCFVQHPLGDQLCLPADPKTPGLSGALIAHLHASDIDFDLINLEEIRTSRACDPQKTVSNPDLPRGLAHQIRTTPALIFQTNDRAEITAGYPKSLARRLQRCRNKLKKHQHEISIGRVNEESCDRLLNEIKSVEDDSWKGTQSVGVFSNPARFSFFGDLAPKLAKRGELYIGVIRIDGEAITYRFGFVYRNVFYDYNLAFKPAFAQLGAGRLLLDEMILQCAQDGVTVFDGSRTGKNTKNLLVERDIVWIAHDRWLSFAPTPAGFYMRLIFGTAKPIGRWLRQKRQAYSKDRDVAAIAEKDATHKVNHAAS